MRADEEEGFRKYTLNFNLARRLVQNHGGKCPIAQMIGKIRSSHTSVNYIIQKCSSKLYFVRVLGAIAKSHIWMWLDSWFLPGIKGDLWKPWPCLNTNWAVSFLWAVVTKKKADSQWERIGLECSHAILPALRRCPACLEILDTQCSHILPLTLTGCQYFWKTSLRASDERCFFWPVSSTNEKKENGLLQSFFSKMYAQFKQIHPVSLQLWVPDHS